MEAGLGYQEVEIRVVDHREGLRQQGEVVVAARGTGKINNLDISTQARSYKQKHITLVGGVRSMSSTSVSNTNQQCIGGYSEQPVVPSTSPPHPSSNPNYQAV